MNGPTRSTAFDRRSAVKGESPRSSSADIYDEFDQFVDSEPVSWGREPRPPQEATPSPPRPAPADDDGMDVWGRRRPSRPAEPTGRYGADEGVEEAPDAAFSPAQQSRRRDAFAKRLSEELSRPTHQDAPQRPSDEGDAPAPTADAAAPAAPKPRRPLATPTAAPAALPPKNEATSEPVDALELELDHAIGAIVAGGLNEAASRPEPAANPAPTLKAEAEQPAPTEKTTPAPSPLQETAKTAPVTSEPGLADIPANKAPAVIQPVGMKRAKPVPSFQFQKREDPDEGFPAAPPDLDDPLSSILFQDAREAVDEARPTGRRGTLNDMARDSVGKALSELEDDLVGEEVFEDPDDLDLAFHDADDDVLPASLSRAAMGDGGRQRSGWRPSGLTMIAGGVGVLAIAGVVGFTVFAGSGEESEAPPIIRADARDVKVRPEDDAEQSARPDIAERADIGEDGRLVLPDEVTITTAEPASTVLDEPGLISRRVRTVVVKPDGTIVPADDSNVEAAQAVAESAAAELSEPSPDRGFSIPTSDTPAVSASPETPEVGEEVAPQAPEADSAIAFAPSVPTPEEVDGQTETIDQLIGDVTEEAAPVPAGVPRRRPTPPPRRQQAALAPSAATQATPAPQAPVNLARPETTAAPAPQAPTTRAPARSDDIQTGVVRPTSPATRQRQATTAAATASPAPAATSAGPWGVQLASQRTRADAQRSAASLRSRYGSILGGAEPVIMEADLGARGRFYRVRVATSTRQEAARLCTRLKSAGADCFIGRN